MRLALIAFAACLVSPAAQACGVDTDCTVEAAESGQRLYRIDKRHGQTGAVIFAHGYRGTAAGVMRNKSLRNAVASEGFALVAPEAKGSGWLLPNGPRALKYSELPYFDALVADLVANRGIDPARIVMSGFSAGGMVTWNLACDRPDLFAGFVPISGTYWKGPPETCPGGVPNIVHIHGTSDRTVPLDGRPIGQTVQGKVSEALAHIQAKGGYAGDERTEIGKLQCSVRTNSDGRLLELCLHPGGHSMPSEFAAAGLSELKKRTPLE